MVADFGSTAGEPAAAARQALSPLMLTAGPVSALDAHGSAGRGRRWHGGRRHVCRRHIPPPPAHTQETQPRVTEPRLGRLYVARWHGPLDPGMDRPGGFKARSSRGRRTPAASAGCGAETSLAVAQACEPVLPTWGGGRPARLLPVLRASPPASSLWDIPPVASFRCSHTRPAQQPTRGRPSTRPRRPAAAKTSSQGPQTPPAPAPGKSPAAGAAGAAAGAQ